MQPWSFFVPALFGKKRKLSDIEYLSTKEFDNKRVDVDNTLTLNNTSTETDLVTQTANAGKDMYLAGASIGGQAVTLSNPIGGVTYRLLANAVEIDRFRVEEPQLNEEWDYKFITKGVKVAAGQIIKITAKNDTAGINRITTHNGKELLFEEATGATPQVPSI